MTEKSGGTQSLAEETSVEYGKDFLQKKSFSTASGNWPYAPMRWFGQMNVLVDICTQLTEETMIAGKPILQTTEGDLLNFILTNFRDKNGKELSFHTISTLLNKSRTDKRLHPQSPKRIDVRRHLKSKK